MLYQYRVKQREEKLIMVCVLTVVWDSSLNQGICCTLFWNMQQVSKNEYSNSKGFKTEF